MWALLLYLTLPNYANTHEQNGFNLHSLRMPIASISRFDIYLEFWRSILLSRLGCNKSPYAGVHMQLDTCCLFATISIFDLQLHMLYHYKYVHQQYLWLKGDHFGAIFGMNCMPSILIESVFTQALFLELVFLSPFCSTIFCLDPSINNQKTGSCMKSPKCVIT